ncbi:unnamed protein product [Rhizophagus irregularis]|nr:unnamed protein product [Rhizophagus irregularis]
MENGELRFVPSGGLLKNGKWRTKILGFSDVFQKMEKTKIRFGWASEEQKTQRFVRMVSDVFPKNGKRRTFIKIHLGGFPKNRKKEPRFVVFPGHEDW